jgi:transposase
MFGVPGVRVLAAERERGGGLRLTVETDRQVEGCHRCGVLAVPHGRREQLLHDAPFGHRRVRVAWRKRVWRCLEPACAMVTFTEAHQLAPPRALLTRRAVLWATDALTDDDTTVSALARRLDVDWHTLWDALKVEAHRRADDPARLSGVESLGVDEHIWRPGKFGAGREVTGMVDLTRDANGQVQGTSARPRPRPVRTCLRRLARRPAARVPGADQVRRPRPVPRLRQRPARLAVRRGAGPGRLPRRQARHPGRRRSPPPSAAGAARPARPQGRPALQDPRAAATRPRAPDERQHARLQAGLIVGDPYGEVELAWSCYQQLRAIYAGTASLRERRTLAEKVIASFPTCPIPEVARLGRTLRAWRSQVLAYFDTDGLSNGGTEAINMLIEKARRLAHGYRNFENYRLRMLLAASGTRGRRVRTATP